MHHPIKYSILFLILFSLLLLISPLAQAGEFKVFGLATYQRDKGKPVIETATFSVKDPTAPYVIRIQNSGRNGEFSPASSAKIWLNDELVVSPGDFRQKIAFIEMPVGLKGSNTLQVEVRGKEGSGFTLEIIGDDRVPPLVSITAPVNGLKTKETIIKVSGTASDATTSVVSVTVNGQPATIIGETFEAQVTSSEGPNTITALAGHRCRGKSGTGIYNCHQGYHTT